MDSSTTDRATTADTVASNDSAENQPEKIPTYDMASTLARHVRSAGGTAADERRKKLATITGNDDEDVGENDQTETAAEKRRRLAALGLGNQHQTGDDSSESEDDLTNSRIRSREAPLRKEEVAQSESQRPRVQWGGDIGRERDITRERDGEDLSATEPSGLGKGMRKARALFKHRDKDKT